MEDDGVAVQEIILIAVVFILTICLVLVGLAYCKNKKELNNKGNQPAGGAELSARSKPTEEVKLDDVVVDSNFDVGADKLEVVANRQIPVQKS